MHRHGFERRVERSCNEDQAGQEEADPPPGHILAPSRQDVENPRERCERQEERLETPRGRGRGHGRGASESASCSPRAARCLPYAPTRKTAQSPSVRTCSDIITSPASRWSVRVERPKSRSSWAA